MKRGRMRTAAAFAASLTLALSGCGQSAGTVFSQEHAAAGSSGLAAPPAGSGTGSRTVSAASVSRASSAEAECIGVAPGNGSESGNSRETVSSASGSTSAGAESGGAAGSGPETVSGAESGRAAGTESAGRAVSSAPDVITSETVSFNPAWLYAGNSKIHSGTATLYHAQPSLARHKTVCVNAGHGTEGGESVKTLCHPDGTPKVTGGSTGAGATEAMAVAGGMEFDDGTPERDVTLALAIAVRDQLLQSGYDVLMIRESQDVQLDNIARTLMANNLADCHIALHYDGTDRDKGVFFMSVPQVDSYLSMEPVASHWQDHDRLGRAVTAGIAAQGFSLFDGGEMQMDLTQTSYSTVPSIDLECGDAASDHSGATFPGLAAGIVSGVSSFFGFAG
ncbi:MAG: N-acetylmuramoyl-L-alanine amidase [Clostridiales bacterium]|nr:N-acetylmuramoyl-L-alanine amidase [Clostridiales bacterium]